MGKEKHLGYIIDSYKNVTILLEQVRDEKITPTQALQYSDRYLRDEVYSALENAGYFNEGE